MNAMASSVTEDQLHSFVAQLLVSNTTASIAGLLFTQSRVDKTTDPY